MLGVSRSRKLAISFAMALALTAAADAQAGIVYFNGMVSAIKASNASTYAIRVFMISGGTNPATGCTGEFVYMNKDDDNYEAKLFHIGRLVDHENSVCAYEWDGTVCASERSSIASIGRCLL